MKPIVFNYSGMVSPEAVSGQLLAMSTDGSYKIVSYLVRRKGRKVYGRYNYQLAVYQETNA